MVKTLITMKKILFCLFVISLISICGVCAEAEDIYTFGNENLLNTRIGTQSINGENTLVLPSAVKPDNVVLFRDFNENAEVYIKGDLKTEAFSSGKSVNLNEFCNNGDYRITFFDKNSSFEEFTVRFLFSENIPSVFLVSDNPEENGRLWVEESIDKSNKATGSMVIQKADGDTIYDGKLTQIKGRGNSTWVQKKKPYQIKTETKVDLLETGNKDNKTKTWLLLANYLDPSLLNNSIVLNLGKALGMKSNIESTHVDLYYDGEYRGNYLLAEKVELGDGRVPVTDLEEKNVQANEGVDLASLPTNIGKTENGAFFKYCDNMNSPEDISGGYLLEMDYEVRAKEEVCYFWTARGQYVVVKSPEYASREEMEYIATLYQDYESAVYNGGLNPFTGKSYSDYVDEESVACYYLLNEFSKARDFFSSSAYLYKNAGEDKMYMGPLWDYDLSFTEGRFEDGGIEHPYGPSIYNPMFGMKYQEIASFTNLIKETYYNKMTPLIEALVSDGETSSGEMSLKKTGKNINASANINAMLWHEDTNWDRKVDELKTFIENRSVYVEWLVNCYPVSVDRNGFKDVLEEDWFYDDITTAKSLGYMNGISENYFDPYSNISRCEIAQVLFNMAPVNEFYPRENFVDVKSEDWFKNAVLWVTDNKIMYGFDDGTFRPKQYSTREELILSLYRYENEPQVKSHNLGKFSDSAEVSQESKNALEWAISKNIIMGDDQNNINPKANLTRAELAAILVRFHKTVN